MCNQRNGMGFGSKIFLSAVAFFIGARKYWDRRRRIKGGSLETQEGDYLGGPDSLRDDL